MVLEHDRQTCLILRLHTRTPRAQEGEAPKAPKRMFDKKPHQNSILVFAVLRRMNHQCSGYDGVISKVSTHSNYYEDRLFSLGCGAVGTGSYAAYFGQYYTWYDETFHKVCSQSSGTGSNQGRTGGYLVGSASSYHSWYRDRRFGYRCRTIGAGAYLHSCGRTG
jgi:hypothetical protein